MSNEEIALEQEYVSMLYHRLDELREHAEGRLASVVAGSGDGTHQGVFERDVSSHMYAERVARLNAVENGLCFGRLDFTDEGSRYVGRIGIFDDTSEHEPLLIDWRAPASQPFYTATAASPEGVWRRRHIATMRRDVTGIDDEVLDHTMADAEDGTHLVGEAALFAALSANRTGQMRDIVATIQAEQDQIIRSGQSGILVVEGGPGTGKTVVALHRAAYLLYTYREQLARRGVLVIGPNTTFLRYVGQVLPSLGETGVVMWTVGEMFPGVSTRREERPDVAAVKGGLGMVDVLKAAVRDRQAVLDAPFEVPFDQNTVTIEPRACKRARTKALRSGRLHNEARQPFVDAMIDTLAKQVAERIGADPFAEDSLGGDDAPGAGALLLDDADVDGIKAELRGDTAVNEALAELWPSLTPERLLADLYSSTDDVMLHRDAGDAWTVADVPLLDEAAELLGEDHAAARAQAERERREREEQLDYAQGVLDIAAGSRSVDLDDDEGEDEYAEVVVVSDVMDASTLVERHDSDEALTIAQRAAADRTWAFGHVIVDEAQELSPMAWRMVLRRCPSKSMTVVGDPAQTGDAAGAESWATVLGPHVGDRWRLTRLSLNYRTSTEIMAVAGRVLAELDPTLTAPRSVRDTGIQPWRLETDPADLPKRLAEFAVAEAEAVGEGRVAVVVPRSRLEELGAAVTAAMPDSEVGADADLASRIVVLDVRQAKGLEFDSVLVADPGRMLTESRRGLNDLYVALTRATERLGIVHEPPAPEPLADVSAG